MLVLTRKPEQKIRIGDEIVITVLKVQGEQVSIGIEAPKHLKIVREELLLDELTRTTIKKNKNSLIKPKPSLEEELVDMDEPADVL